MPDLKNELKWSHTRQQRWDTCRRLYYLAHYAHWNGWRSDAPEMARRCYIFTKMVNLPMLAGDVVHRVIEKILRDHRAGHSRSGDAWVAEARRLLNEGWKQSRDRAWERDPKRNINLFEHCHGLAIGEADIARTRERVAACVEHFLASETWRAIRLTDPGNWRTLEELSQIDLGDFGLWVKIDFAFTDAEGLVWLIDWKTGREEEEHRDQLLAYALYANRAWGVPPEEIRLVPVYLREGAADTLRVTAADLAGAERRILDACREMAAACDDPTRNTASIENFPMIEDRRVCARCFFQSICFKPDALPCKDAAGQVT
jgi:hypothetical protein